MKLLLLSSALLATLVAATDKPAGDFIRVSFQVRTVFDQMRIITAPRDGYSATGNEHRPTVWLNSNCKPDEDDVWVPGPTESSQCCQIPSLDGFKIWEEKQNVTVNEDVYVDYLRPDTNQQCTTVNNDIKSWRDTLPFGKYNSYIVQSFTEQDEQVTVFNALIEFHK